MSSEAGDEAVREEPRPLFQAVTSSTRPLHQLLKCISFSSKLHVDIGPQLIRFSAEKTRVMQGTANWDKGLFSSYTINPPPVQHNEDDSDDSAEADIPPFQISLSALMETLQIFGAADAAVRKNDPDSYKSNLRNYKGSDAFLANGISANLSSGTCSLTYNQPGDPFRIQLEESGVKTACNLVTYIPEELEDIPFDMLGISFKIIMESRHLLDALAEIVPTSPDKLTIAVSRKAPYLLLKSTGSMGSTSVDFAKGKHLFESFEVRERWKETFHFDLIKATTEAMRVASKVSLRGDPEGVLNLQFMVEVDGAKNYLEYRLVAYSSLGESGSEDEDDQEEVAESLRSSSRQG